MFYLVSQTENGHRLIDFSAEAKDLTPQISTLLKDNPSSTPIVMTDVVMTRTYLVDKFGIPAQEQDGYLVQIEDLVL